MVDGCSEKSHIAMLFQKQELLVAAIRDWKNTNHDQSKIPRSASNSVWNHSWPKRQEVQSGKPNHSATTLSQDHCNRHDTTSRATLACHIDPVEIVLFIYSDTGRWCMRSERVRLDMMFFKTILGISVQPHHVVKLREMFRIKAPYWRRRILC